MAKYGVGQPVRRIEDPRLLTGRGKYNDDLPRNGEAMSFVLRSPHAHADIKFIDTTAAKAMPGILDVFTAQDLEDDGIGVFPGPRFDDAEGADATEADIELLGWEDCAENMSFRVDKAWRQRCSQRFRNILDMIAKKADHSVLRLLQISQQHIAARLNQGPRDDGEERDPSQRPPNLDEIMEQINAGDRDAALSMMDELIDWEPEDA